MGEDVGSNFFLLSSTIGESRAKATCQLLQELNDQVRGNYDQRVCFLCFPISLLTTDKV